MTRDGYGGSGKKGSAAGGRQQARAAKEVSSIGTGEGNGRRYPSAAPLLRYEFASVPHRRHVSCTAAYTARRCEEKKVGE